MACNVYVKSQQADCFRQENIKSIPIGLFHRLETSPEGQERLGYPVDNGSLPTRGFGRLPGPLSDQHGLSRRGIPTDLVFDHCIIIQAKDEG